MVEFVESLLDKKFFGCEKRGQCSSSADAIELLFLHPASTVHANDFSASDIKDGAAAASRPLQGVMQDTGAPLDDRGDRTEVDSGDQFTGDLGEFYLCAWISGDANRGLVLR